MRPPRFAPGDRVVITRWFTKDREGDSGVVDWYYGEVDAFGGRRRYAVTTDRPWMGDRFIRIEEADLRPEEDYR